jgi:pimeloyl-ACP methyl ester carboxylesterase
MRGRDWTWQSVAHDGVVLSMRSDGDGPTVVLLTGLGSLQQAWGRVARLLRNDHRVITFDYRGHGRSSPAVSYSFDSFLDDVAAVLQAAAVTRPILCGWSFGADLAVWFAACQPGS